MNAREKTELAIGLLKRHGDVYGRKVPKRLVSFWQKGEALAATGKCVPAGLADIPSLGDGSFRLMAAAPSWEVQGELGGVDGGIVGPGGEWKGASACVPLFHAEESRFFVARIDDPKCPVGWYEEETFDEDGEGYVDGVFMVAPSLDAFLKALVPLDEADNETIDEETWDVTWDGVPEVLHSLEETDVEEDREEGEEDDVVDEDLDQGKDLDVEEDEDLEKEDLDDDEDLDEDEDEDLEDDDDDLDDDEDLDDDDEER